MRLSRASDGGLPPTNHSMPKQMGMMATNRVEAMNRLSVSPASIMVYLYCSAQLCFGPGILKISNGHPHWLIHRVQERLPGCFPIFPATFLVLTLPADAFPGLHYIYIDHHDRSFHDSFGPPPTLGILPSAYHSLTLPDLLQLHSFGSIHHPLPIR